MPPVTDAANLYSETGQGRLSPAVSADPPRVYVPNLQSNDVYVIDPATLKVIDKFRVGTSSRRGTCARSGSRTTPRAAPTAA
jgi:YVTN family beta-propeller protein